MTPKCLQLELQTGYTVAYQSDTVDLDRAVEKLTTRRQLQYTMANRKDMRAILIRHRLGCPYCDHRIPAYGRPWDPNPAGRVPRPRVLQWGDPQLTMFGHPDPLLNLQEVRLPEGGYRCEKCGRWISDAMFNSEVHECVKCAPWENYPRYCPQCGIRILDIQKNCPMIYGP